jgi:hypothetical protein
MYMLAMGIFRRLLTLEPNQGPHMANGFKAHYDRLLGGQEK